MAYPIILYMKRRHAQILAFTLSGIGSVIYNYMTSVIWRYVFIFVVKFGIAISFIIVYVLTTELYPTEIRGLAFGLSNTFGRVGTIFATLMT
jgi:MFS family permease